MVVAKKIAKNSPPVYALGPNFCVSHIATFDKTSGDVVVKALPDDLPDTKLVFDEAVPPCVDDFSIEVKRFKKATGRWVAHLENGPWYPSGAAILLQLSPLKYAYLGETFMTFEMQPKDEFVDFRVRLDGSRAVAWIRGKNNTYLLSSRLYIPNAHVESCGSAEDPYDCQEGCEGQCHEIRNALLLG
jgi:hypothetical protein